MIRFNSGIANAKLTAGIPLMSTVQASVLNPGAALPPFMVQGVRPENYIPQALMNVYVAIDNASVSSIRV